MKTNGIVRNIDDLGRIVIPKEIRKVLQFREGDPLEIFVGEDGIVMLKKYSPLGRLGAFVENYINVLSESMPENGIIITDCETVLTATKNIKSTFMGDGYMNIERYMISQELQDCIRERQKIKASTYDRTFIPILKSTLGIGTSETDFKPVKWEMIQPIMANGDVFGAVVLISDNVSKTFSKVEDALIECAAKFLGHQVGN